MPNAFLHLWPVSTRVNKTSIRDDDPSLIEPIEINSTGFRGIASRAAIGIGLEGRASTHVANEYEARR